MTKITSTLSSRERVNLALEHKETDRIPRMESFWGETIENWKKQGMPEGIDLNDYFGFDMRGAGWMNMCAYPGRMTVLRETDEWISYLDGQGAVVRYWKNKAGTPEHESFTVKDRDTWETHKKALLSVPVEKRIDLDFIHKAQKSCEENQHWFFWCGVECFEICKDIFGHE